MTRVYEEFCVCSGRRIGYWLKSPTVRELRSAMVDAEAARWALFLVDNEDALHRVVTVGDDGRLETTPE